ncbi:MAG: MarR family transcriptional regulator [Kutzneria sp.]|nr:MarR family transcriptional regulator [Kutzneria sp.]MBV9847754.1 MarR family transcriptional regulator [Kutzneria sp.]
MSLTSALMTLQRWMHGTRSVIARELGLTVQQIELLCVLHNHKPSFGELAGLLGCDKTNVTGMVDRLTRLGLVTREADPRDRRISRPSLTDEGGAVGERVREAFVRAVAERWSGVSPRDRARLARLIDTDRV